MSLSYSMDQQQPSITMKGWWIIIDDWYVYIVYRTSVNDYSLPKWRLEPGETIEQCAVREVLEETWLHCEIISLCDTVEYSFQDEGITHDCKIYFYIMRLLDETVHPLAYDVAEVHKVTIEEALHMLTYETDKALLQKAISQL